MKSLAPLLIVVVLAAGCQRTVVVKDRPGPPAKTTVVHVHDDNCGHVWDGERYIVIHKHVHRPGCGHHYHHGGWHLYPAHHVYRHRHHHHLGVTVHVR